MSKFFEGSGVFSCILALAIPIFFHELPYKIWFPYDYKNNEFLFWLSVAFQGFESTCFCVIDLVYDTIIAMFLCCILGMLEEICDKLEKIDPTDELRKSKNRDSKNISNSKIKIEIEKENHNLQLGKDKINSGSGKIKEIRVMPFKNSSSKSAGSSQSKLEIKRKVIEHQEKEVDIQKSNMIQLLECIDLHFKVLEINRKVGSYFSVIVMVQGMMSTLILCTTAYALTIVR